MLAAARFSPPPSGDVPSRSVDPPSAVPAPPVIADSLMGKEYQKSVVVGGQTVPLPQGTWVALASFKGTYAAPGDTMVLGNLEGAELKGLIAVNAYLGPSPTGTTRPSAACQRQDVIFLSAAPAQGDSLECWWVNHATSVWQDQAPFKAAYLELAQRKIAAPDVFINVGFYRATPKGFATTFYFFDPATEGIASAPGRWFDSEWRKDRLVNDPARAAYAAKMIQWGREWAPIFFGR
jgi:hypothetical protein